MWPSRRRVHRHADGLQGVVSPFQDFHCKVRHGAILTTPPCEVWHSPCQRTRKCIFLHVRPSCVSGAAAENLKGCSPQPHTYGAVSSYTERCLLRGRSQNRLNSWAHHLTGYCEWPQTNTSSSFSRSDPEASWNQPLRPGSVQGSMCQKRLTLEASMSAAPSHQLSRDTHVSNCRPH